MIDTQTALRLPIGLAAAFLALLLVAPGAGAAPRFATPAGSGTQCSQAQPCDVVTAVNQAADGDDISIAPGTYGPLSEALDDDEKSLTIHGQIGARPKIVSTATYAFELSGPKSSLTDVTIESSESIFGFWVTANIPVERVYSHVSADGAIACYPRGILNDSVCWASGENGIGATALISNDASATLRNDTVIASGPGGVAVRAVSAIAAKMEIDLIDTIARGASADLFVQTGNLPTSVASIEARYSNYEKVEIDNGGGGSVTKATAAGSGTNVTTPPLFVDAAAGNFEQSPSSAGTIDRGENSPLNGLFDLDGTPRTLPGGYGCGASATPATTDIGAYEHIAPVPTCVQRTPAGKVRITRTTANRKRRRLTFAFSSDAAPGGYECRLQKLRKKKKRAKAKGAAVKKGKKPPFKSCVSPRSYAGKRPGRYRFEVRALGTDGTAGPAAAKTLRLKPPRVAVKTA